jgi:hypothetical protein
MASTNAYYVHTVRNANVPVARATNTCVETTTNPRTVGPHKYFSRPSWFTRFAFVLTVINYRPTMTTDEQSTTQQERK